MPRSLLLLPTPFADYPVELIFVLTLKTLPSRADTSFDSTDITREVFSSLKQLR